MGIRNSLNASRQIKLKTFPDSPPSSKNFLEVSQGRSLTLSVCLHSVNCVCIVHLICLNLCVQAGPTSNLLDESELLTGWEVFAIKNRMREEQAMKASAR